MARGVHVCVTCLALTLLRATAFGAMPDAPAVAPFDLSGVWMNDNTLDERMKREGRKRQTEEELRGPSTATTSAASLLTPAYLAIYQGMQAAAAQNEVGVESCEWPGMPTIMTHPYPFEALVTPGRITFIFEVESQVRRIFLDRNVHLDPDELDPSYNGDSIGHWEGDTLVIDTVGFNTRRPVRGFPHSEQMQIIERITPVDANTIKDEITIIDKEAFRQPLVINVQYSRRPDWRIREYSCAENNRDAPDALGRRSGGVVRQEGMP